MGLIVSLQATRKEGGGPAQFLATSENALSLDPGDIVSLEGPNQSGKSTIIGTLVGAYQTVRPGKRGRAEIQVNHTMQLNGRAFAPRSVREAAHQGVTAVFQNDNLIPTMTVAEQLCLRHAVPNRISGFLSAIWGVVRPKIVAGVNGLSAMFPPEGKVHQLVGRVAAKIPEGRKSEKEIRAKAIALFEEFDVPGQEPFSKNLDKFPYQLSGGAKAIVRIVSALMEPRVRILLLDEAFAGVDPAVWTRAIGALRKRRENLAILFVSHVPSERVRWRPNKRFEIRSGVLRRMPSPAHAKNVLPSLARPGKDVSVFEIQSGPTSTQLDDYDWLKDFSKPVIVVLDKALEAHPAASQLLHAAAGGGSLAVFAVAVSESEKTLETTYEILRFLATNIKNETASIVCVGGGTLLNVAGFAASIFLRGRVPVLYVPTTVTAIADVAIGSKTGVNQRTTKDDIARKHSYGTYFDPTAIVLDKRFVRTSDRRTRILECAEVFKQALLQSRPLLDRVLKTLERAEEDDDAVFEAAVEASILKLDVAQEDFEERAVGRILQFGHLHAHSLERASNFTKRHNLAVWCGVFIDCLVGGGVFAKDPGLKPRMVALLREVLKGESLPTNDELLSAYEAETKIEPVSGVKEYSLVSLSEVGGYSDITRVPLATKLVSWHDLAGAWDEIRANCR